MNNSNFLGWYAKRLAVAAFLIALLQVSTASLVAYVGASGISDPGHQGAVVAFSLTALIVGTLFSTVVHFFIMGVASVFVFLGLAFVRNGRTNNDNVGGTPAPTAGGDAALKSFAKKFVIVVLLVAAALSLYQSLGVYVVLSAVSQAAGLVLLATVMTFMVTFIYGTFVVGFIGAVASFMVAILLAVFGGRGNRAAR